MIKFSKNGYSLHHYNGRLVAREIAPSEITNDVIWPDNFSTPYIGKSRFRWKNLLLGIEFKADNQLQIELNKSKVHSLLDNHYITFSDFEGWRFFCVVSAQPATSESYNGKFQTLTYNLLCYMEEDEPTSLTMGSNAVVITLDSEYTETPMTLEVQSTSSAEQTITVNGKPIKIKGGNLGKTIIGDGKVLRDGQSVWEDVELKAFPFLEAGQNQITKDSRQTVVIKYRRRLK